jgi:hypothetical protein
MDLSKIFVTVVSGILFLIFLSFVLSWPVYMLWNGCLVGAVTGINEVTWLQAWGLNILAGFLFKHTVLRVKE